MEHKQYSELLIEKFEALKLKSGRGSNIRLAKAAGCSPSMITRWLNGSKTPSMELLVRIAEAILIEQALVEGRERELNKKLEAMNDETH